LASAIGDRLRRGLARREALTVAYRRPDARVGRHRTLLASPSQARTLKKRSMAAHPPLALRKKWVFAKIRASGWPCTLPTIVPWSFASVSLPNPTY